MVDVVFAFFSDPHNLPLLMPEKLQTRIERMMLEPPPPNPLFPAANGGGQQQAAGVGSRIELSFRPIPYVPIRVRWEAHITEFAWNSHFCDEQVKGPFRSFYHRHGIRAEMQQGRMGTELVDEIDFELPLGTIGQLGNAAVRSQLKRTFAMRQQRLPGMLDAAIRPVA